MIVQTLRLLARSPRWMAVRVAPLQRRGARRSSTDTAPLLSTILEAPKSTVPVRQEAITKVH